jgi:hypothetical protein
MSLKATLLISCAGGLTYNLGPTFASIQFSTVGEIAATGFQYFPNDNGTITTALALDFSLSASQKFTLTASTNPTITVATAPSNACDIVFQIVAPASNTPTITWPATFKGGWPSSITATKTIVLKGYFDGTNYILLSSSSEY